MTNELMNLYNNFIKLTTNKKLYFYLDKQDNFSDRLKIFLLHFAFFLKVFKKNIEKLKLQKIYDFIFRQLELSIREIGYGDQSINKKMKDYLNLFHDILGEIHFWDNLDNNQKNVLLKKYIITEKDLTVLKEYFDKYDNNLKKNTFHFYLKSVID